MLWLQVHNVYAILADQALFLPYRYLFRASPFHDIPLHTFLLTNTMLFFHLYCPVFSTLTAPYISSFSRYPIFHRQFLSFIFTHKCTLVFHIHITRNISFVVRCTINISTPVRDSRSSRSPSAFPNNLSKPSLLIIQSARFPCVRQTLRRKKGVDRAKRGLDVKRVSGRMFIRIQAVKYARGMNNAVTMYNRIHRNWLYLPFR